MAEFIWGKARLHFELHGRDAVLCNDKEQATRAAKALATALGTHVIGPDEDVRGTFRDLFPKAPAHPVHAVLSALQLGLDALDWKLKHASPLRRLLAATAAAVASGEPALVFQFATFPGTAFDRAYIYQQINALHLTFGVQVVVVIVDPALIASSGTHLTVLGEDGIAESASVTTALSDPRSDLLLARLQATPVPNPLAMQQRRVQRAATMPINFANTQVVQLPTADSIALAGGDVSD